MIQIRGYDYRFVWRLDEHNAWVAKMYFHDKRVKGEMFIHNCANTEINVSYKRVTILAVNNSKNLSKARDLAADLFILLHQR
jgi:hypothetical protein